MSVFEKAAFEPNFKQFISIWEEQGDYKNCVSSILAAQPQGNSLPMTPLRTCQNVLTAWSSTHTGLGAQETPVSEGMLQNFAETARPLAAMISASIVQIRLVDGANPGIPGLAAVLWVARASEPRPSPSTESWGQSGGWRQQGWDKHDHKTINTESRDQGLMCSSSHVPNNYYRADSPRCPHFADGKTEQRVVE